MPLFVTDPSSSDLSILVTLARAARIPGLDTKPAEARVQGERARHIARLLVTGGASAPDDVRDVATIRRMAGVSEEQLPTAG